MTSSSFPLSFDKVELAWKSLSQRATKSGHRIFMDFPSGLCFHPGSFFRGYNPNGTINKKAHNQGYLQLLKKATSTVPRFPLLYTSNFSDGAILRGGETGEKGFGHRGSSSEGILREEGPDSYIQ